MLRVYTELEEYRYIQTVRVDDPAMVPSMKESTAWR